MMNLAVRYYNHLSSAVTNGTSRYFKNGGIFIIICTICDVNYSRKCPSYTKMVNFVLCIVELFTLYSNLLLVTRTNVVRMREDSSPWNLKWYSSLK